ncbi:hypothetical protein AB1Y20_009039 [Prymnesium parvum]|uniref:BSD domain-containing protein n=1 Tax=Prymnesium parvum TaxID=97485 RepID=A0AB34K322_PRYPA
MGAAASQEDLGPPFPLEWLVVPSAVGVAVEALNRITALSLDDFASASAPIPELEDTAWELDAYRNFATAAVMALPGLNSLVYKCVPKRMPESEFWRLFFCHAHAVVLSVSTVSQAVIEKGDDTTSSEIISVFEGDATFLQFSQAEMDGIVRRDAEDDEKLAAGIRMAIEKGVIPASPAVEPLTKIDVLGKTAEQVAAEIVRCLGDSPGKGCVLVLQGLSGTGKGTTVSKLEQMLPRATCWSNGNVFRSLTLLAVTACEQMGVPLRREALTPQLLAELMSCLHFAKFNGKFDIAIKGYGFDLLVSQVANTVLKGPNVGKNIPTVAEMTQGEVIKFAAAAAEAMRADGMNVLMEGRAQTLDYVRTPHRFELLLSQERPLVIGKRRAAQRMMGAAQAKLKAMQKSNVTRFEMTTILNEELQKLFKA